MSIEKALRQEGIEIVSMLNPLEINKIANTISNKLCDAFPEHNLNQDKLRNAISHLNMYIAKFPTNDSVAKYFYKNSSIYFSDKIDLNDINTLALHECIHFIQEVKNNNKLVRLGLYKANSNKGMAINEAAVQYMASIATNCEQDSVRYYGMNMETISADYYPIQTALINQIIYFTGTYPLYHSTIFSDDIFENTVIAQSSKAIYNTICKNFDLIVHLEEQLAKFTYELYTSGEKTSESKIKKIHDKQEKARKLIFDTTLSTQNIILYNLANSEFEKIETVEAAKAFQTKLYNFKNLLINCEDYNYFNEFYIEMMNKLSEKRELIESGALSPMQKELSLVDQSKDPLYLLRKLFEKIKLLIEDKLREKDF